MPLQESHRFLQEREFWFPFGAYRMRYVHMPAHAPPPCRLPAVVFVHGLMGSSFSWRHNLEFFAQHRDVYAIDLLGTGHSDRPQTGAVDFGLAAAATRLLEFLRSLGHSQIDLVGTSHGGAVAMLAASQDCSNPEPVIRRLVLAAPAHPFMTNARLRLAFLRTSFGRMVMRGLVWRSPALRARRLAGMYADGSRVTPETRAGYAVTLESARSCDYGLEVVRTWRPDMLQLQAALRSISAIPVLLLWGEADPVVSAASGLLLREFFSDVEYVVLPNVGHMPYEEAPGEFNRQVLHFLQK
jgi:pimeloyl-ACP methyl ester carboxylesterase